jgi:hypothetical protein
MTEGKQAWLDALRSFIAEARNMRPAASLDALSPQDRKRQGVHHAAALEFQGQARQAMSERRIVLEQTPEYEPEPVLIMTGDPMILTAFRSMYADDRVLMGKGNWFFPLTEDEYRAFLAAKPEPREFMYHAHWWSIFEAQRVAEPDLKKRVGMWLDPEVPVLDHRIGLQWGPRHGFEWTSLWRVADDSIELVKEKYATRRFTTHQA